jgi:hypothetical protein
MILFPKTYEAIRRVGGRVNGVWKDSAETTITFEGNCQPTSGRDLDPQLVGRHQSGLIKAWSHTKLEVSEEGTNHRGDLILWEGSQWEVIQQLPNAGEILGPGVVYKYIAARR